MTAVVAKLVKSLKNKLMKAYSAVLIKTQRGYPLEGYQSILDAISAIDYIEEYEIDEVDQVRIIEACIFNLENEK